MSVIQVGEEPQVIATIQTGPGWEPLERGEPLTVPEVHYRVKHSPYRSELVRYGQFQFNEASWTLQGEYSCASCHYERGQTTGLIWAGSPFRNEDGSLTDAQKRGWKVFSDPKVGCIECHPGDPKNPRALFSDA